MDGAHFDRWTRALGFGPAPRRSVLRLLAGGALGALLTRFGPGPAAAACAVLSCARNADCESCAGTVCRSGECCRPERAECTKDGQCCSGACLANGTCKCVAAKCPQPPSASCEAYCRSRVKCGFRNEGDAASCDPGDACIENATCNRKGRCVGTPKGCSDDIDCTDDSCDPATGECIHTANNKYCASRSSSRCLEGHCAPEDPESDPATGCVFDRITGGEILTCGFGPCHNSVQECVDGVEQECVPHDVASEEVCDGIDNDCDGQIDEDGVCPICGNGICERGEDCENCPQDCSQC